MKILHRARHLYSDKYLISESVKFKFNQMYLFVNKKWTECDESTRSINFSDILDINGTKIFASISDYGKGGDILDFEGREISYKYSKDGVLTRNSIVHDYEFKISLAKVTGIKQ